MPFKSLIKSLISLVFFLIFLLLIGCTIKLVQPYDEKLLADTDAIFKKASLMIDDGIQVSPTTDDARKLLASKSDNLAKATNFDIRYLGLSTDADALILKALSKSQDIDPAGKVIENKVTNLIEKKLPIEECKAIENDIGNTYQSLTVKNYIDLKCMFVLWQIQHNDDDLTNKTKILKQINWELRKKSLFSAILAIEKAETSKNH